MASLSFEIREIPPRVKSDPLLPKGTYTDQLSIVRLHLAPEQLLENVHGINTFKHDKFSNQDCHQKIIRVSSCKQGKHLIKNEQEIAKYHIVNTPFSKPVIIVSDSGNHTPAMIYENPGISLTSIPIQSVKTLKNITRCALEALAHLHEMGFIHHNVCLENLHMNSKKEVFLTGFAFAGKAGGNFKHMYIKPKYNPPEKSIKGALNAPSKDIWSLGETLEELYDSNIENIEEEPLFFDLIDKMKKQDPLLRITADEALQHPFLTNTPFIATILPQEEIIGDEELPCDIRGISPSKKPRPTLPKTISKTISIKAFHQLIDPYRQVEIIRSGNGVDTGRTKTPRQRIIKYARTSRGDLLIENEQRAYDLFLPNTCEAHFDDRTEALFIENGGNSLDKFPSFSFSDIYKIGKKVLETLGALHLKLYIHQDIKPSNIVLSSDGVVRLIDFGLLTYFNKFRKFQRVGTKEFFPPCLDTILNNPYAKDLWALGVTLKMLLNKCSEDTSSFAQFIDQTFLNQEQLLTISAEKVLKQYDEYNH